MRDYFFCDDGFGHIAVAGGAGDSGLKMRGVAEFDVGIFGKAVDADPWNFNAFVVISGHLFHFGISGQKFGVAKHTFLNRGDSGRGAGVGTGMAINACHSQSNVLIVREGDGLLCHEVFEAQRG